MRISTLFIFIIGFCGESLIQEGFGQTNPTPLSTNEKKQVVDSVGKILNDYYIFPEEAKKAADFILKNSENGAYEKITDPRDFGNKLTDDVVSVIHDKHFHVFFDPEQVADERNAISSKDSSLLIKKEIENGIEYNFGFMDVKILDGNIGYINFDGFEDLQYSAETINGAMSLLSNTKAMIIDVRNNHGGYSNTGEYISSFFFSQEPVVLVDIYTRSGVNTVHQQSQTMAYVNGKRRVNVPLYILTSSFSFSAAEALAYALQSLKRAVIIGEITGGGANFWDGKIATDRFYVHVPDGRVTDPRTKTNWEGVGVKPDIEVPAKDALITAHIKALEKLAATDTTNASRYNWHLAAAKSKLKPVTIDQNTLKSYTGKYGSRNIVLENGKLYLQENGGTWEMLPMSATLFRLEDINIERVQIIIESGTVKGITRFFNNGTSRTHEKEK